jgi:hypothetical protein
MILNESSDGVNIALIAILMTAALLVSGFIVFFYTAKGIPLGYHILNFFALSLNFLLIIIQPIDIYKVSLL